jgi:hypothetical protein
MQLNTSIIFRRKFYYTFIITCLSFVGLAFGLSKVFHNSSISGILLLIVFGIVITGDYIFKKLYVRKLKIDIGEETICFCINYAKRLDEIRVSFAEIESYSMDIINPKFYELRLKLKTGKKISISLPQVKSVQSNDDSLEVLETINSKIGEFNKQNESDPIILRPTFYARFAGKVVIITLSILAIFTLIFNLYYTIKASFFGLLFAVIVIVQLYIRRQNNIDFYYKMYDANL